MAEAKTIQQLSFLGNGRTMIGELIIKKDNPVPKKSKKGEGIIKHYEDFGRYKKEVHKKGQEIVKDRLTMEIGVKVDGATHFITLYGEDTSDKGNKKKFKLRKKDGQETAEEITVPLNETEKYIDEAMNTMVIGLLTDREIMEVFPETANDKDLFEKYKRGAKFVSTHAVIQYLCKNREKFRGRRVIIKAAAEMEEYNGNVRMKGFGFNSIYLNFDYKRILEEEEFRANYTEEVGKINTNTDLSQEEKAELIKNLADRFEKVDETIVKLQEKIKSDGDSYLANIPVYIPLDFATQAIKNPKGGKLTVGIIAQRQQEDGSYAKKIVRVKNFFELHDTIKNNATPEMVEQIANHIDVSRDRIVLMNLEVRKGSEQGADADIDRSSLSDGDKILFDAYGAEEFAKIMKKQNIAMGVRGQAKEKAILLGFPQELEDAVEIKDEDFDYDVNKVENEIKTVDELKQAKAVTPPAPVAPPTAPAGM